MIAFIFPGQGSQSVGMGRALADAYPEAAAAFAEADAAYATAAGDEPDEGIAARSLSEVVFEGPAEELMRTERAQPAILTMSVAASRVLAGFGVEPAIVAGHSLGEYSAHVVAGTLTLPEAVATVRRRGRYMQDAVPAGAGAMAAVLGADQALVQQACDEAAEGEVVSPANINGPGQVVIAGTVSAVARAGQRARALGARRVIPLSVSAPFHCALMAPAEARLAPNLRALSARAPRVPVVASVDAGLRREAGPAVEALIRQVCAPVQWEAVVHRLAREGVTTYVEVGPGTVLGGLVRKIQNDARILHFGSPGDLGAVVAACSISAAR